MRIKITSANWTGIVWYRLLIGQIFEVVALEGDQYEVKHQDDARYYVWKQDAELFQPEAIVGKAFRCPDGLIRWITHFSARKYFTLLWLDEPSNTWHNGGIIKADKWEGGSEVPIPKNGEIYKLAGATGLVSERTAA